MKQKYLLLAAVALLLLGGLWFRRHSLRESLGSDSGASENPLSAPNRTDTPKGQTGARGARQPLLPPNPNRAFEELTPEQRVQRARHPQGVGG
jgi:hypothetical protein